MNEKNTTMWQNVTVFYGRKNTYNMYVDESGKPVRYEMYGYNSLLGSHYDRYYLDYQELANFTGDPFEIPKSK